MMYNTDGVLQMHSQRRREAKRWSYEIRKYRRN